MSTLSKLVFAFQFSHFTIASSNDVIPRPLLQSGEQMLSYLLQDENLVKDVTSHGCWCSRLDSNRERSNTGGTSHGLDELDAICQEWFHTRRCNEATSCTDSTESNNFYEILNVQCLDYLQCTQSSCKIDLEYATRILNFLQFNPDWTSLESTCDHRTGQPTCEDFNIDDFFTPRTVPTPRTVTVRTPENYYLAFNAVLNSNLDNDKIRTILGMGNNGHDRSPGVYLKNDNTLRTHTKCSSISNEKQDTSFTFIQGQEHFVEFEYNHGSQEMTITFDGVTEGPFDASNCNIGELQELSWPMKYHISDRTSNGDVTVTNVIYNDVKPSDFTIAPTDVVLQNAIALRKNGDYRLYFKVVMNSNLHGGQTRAIFSMGNDSRDMFGVYVTSDNELRTRTTCTQDLSTQGLSQDWGFYFVEGQEHFVDFEYVSDSQEMIVNFDGILGGPFPSLNCHVGEMQELSWPAKHVSDASTGDFILSNVVFDS